MTAHTATVRVTEVGPWDGLQNIANRVPTSAKVDFVRDLVAAGHRDVIVSSFVRPDLVPQLADADEVFRALGAPPPGVTYAALVPNERGLARAEAVGVGKVALLTAATETFSERNTNASVGVSLDRCVAVARAAKASGLRVRGSVAVALGCPFEGRVAPEVARDVAVRLADMDCDEVVLCDTIGVATPNDVARLLECALPALVGKTVGLHLHDTGGRALHNVAEGLRHDVRAFDASSGGLGGCPFAPGAPGNLATENLIELLDAEGYEHGLDLEAQRRATKVVRARTEAAS